MLTSSKPDQAPSRRLSFVVLPFLAAALLSVAGCGDSGKPAVCGSLDNLSTDVNELKNIDPKEGEAAMSEIESSFDSIRTDLAEVKADANEELSEPIAGLQSSLDALSTKVDAAKTQGSLSAATVQGIADSLAAVRTSWETLKSSAPDCNS